MRTYLIVFFILYLLAASFPCIASQRVALVIGNGEYAAAPLRNPANDAKDMAAALRTLGFEVFTKANASKREMIKGIDLFADKLRRSEIGLFYYAGHGMQINGRNYLIPVKTAVQSESDVEFESVDVGRVLGKMKGAGNKLNVVVLDACRNNPFERSFRSGAQGLARMDAPVGTIIAYATGPGSVAADGKGRNGIYTKHLLHAFNQPDLTIQEVFNDAGIGVMQETGNMQVPWMSNTPIPRFFLAGSGATPAQRQVVKDVPGNLKKSTEQEQQLSRSYTDLTTGMKFVLVKGGCYQMGDIFGDGSEDEGPVHEVCVDDFYMGKYEVTQGEYRKIIGFNPSHFKKGDRYPVEQVSWNDTQSFIRKLNLRANQQYRFDRS